MTTDSGSSVSARMRDSYFPNIPPPAPKAAMSYSRSVEEAPFTALMGVVVDGRHPLRHPVTPRCRMRNQVGFTNRWRLPESLGSDFLGTAQAVKAIRVPYNASMTRILTAENPKNSVNMDVSNPYKFRVNNDRPSSTLAKEPLFWSSGSRVRTAPNKLKRPGPFSQYTPSSARPSKPIDVFYYHSKRSMSQLGPDVLLQCLEMNWELHRPYLQKTATLANLLSCADSPEPKKYYRSKVSENLDSYISKNKYYTNEYQEMSNRLSTADRLDTGKADGVKHPKHISEERARNMTVIKLDISDPLVTRHAMATALGNLYHEETEVPVSEVVGVFAAAHILCFERLQEGCAKIMTKSISASTACAYYQAAVKYNQSEVETACLRWLELNLVPKLSTQIQLRQLPVDLLQRVLKSNRLFTTSESALYRVLAYWVFLYLNPHVQLMPSYNTLLTYFNSLPKSTSLMEREEGQDFACLFLTLRLHGIMDISSIQDIQAMNILPQNWVVKLLTQHYQALQGGGDMSLMSNFNSGAIRQGFVVDAEPHYYSEIMSLYGFHFELRAVRENKKDGSYSFFLQRLKPSDPVLSFRQCERDTFSMRPDREVRYAIRVQNFDADNQYQSSVLGMLTHRFGLGDKTSKSQVLTLDNLQPPIYVSYSLLFPPS